MYYPNAPSFSCLILGVQRPVVLLPKTGLSPALWPIFRDPAATRAYALAREGRGTAILRACAVASYGLCTAYTRAYAEEGNHQASCSHDAVRVLFLTASCTLFAALTLHI